MHDIVSGWTDGRASSWAASRAASKTFLTAGEMKTVTVISDQIIPRTDTPGATDVGVPAFVDRMMAGYYQDNERKAMRAGLARIDKDAPRPRMA